jgi:hypothetical protein
VWVFIGRKMPGQYLKNEKPRFCRGSSRMLVYKYC